MLERQISLDGLPEPMAHAIEVMVESARQLATNSGKREATMTPLPVWNLGVKQPVRREDYYDGVE